MTGSTNRAAILGALFYGLWGVVHVLGAAAQLQVLHADGGLGLARMIATARPPGPNEAQLPAAAGAFMGMGAYNILWIGLLVTIIAAVGNRRNSRLAYWLNLAIVGATDLGLVFTLLWPGIMSWRDGGIGLGLFAAALIAATLGRRGAVASPGADG